MIYTLGTRPKKGYTFLPLLLLPGNKFEICNNRITKNHRLARLLIDPLGREKLLDGGDIDFCTDDICIIMLEYADKARIVPLEYCLSGSIVFANTKWTEEREKALAIFNSFSKES